MPLANMNVKRGKVHAFEPQGFLDSPTMTVYESTPLRYSTSRDRGTSFDQHCFNTSGSVQYRVPFGFSRLNAPQSGHHST